MVTDHPLCYLGLRLSTYWTLGFPNAVLDMELTVFIRKTAKSLWPHHFVQASTNIETHDILKYAQGVVDSKSLWISPLPASHLLSLWTRILLKSILLLWVLIRILVWIINSPQKLPWWGFCSASDRDIGKYWLL